jgi:phosphatidylglycerophosphate synthase
MLTLANLVITVAGSVALTAGADRADRLWVPGWLALACWQLGYVLDCADGQLARATGKKSDFGARVDVLVDFAVKISIVVAIVAVAAQFSDPPVILLALFIASWFESLIIGILARSDGNIGHSFMPGRGAADVVKLVRDTPFILLVLGIWLLVAPHNLIIPIAAIASINLSFVVASIAREAYLSMRHTWRAPMKTAPNR